MFKKIFLETALLSCIVLGNAFSEVEITKEGIPNAAILLGESPSFIERHCAQELTKYIKGLSGSEIAISEFQIPKEKNIILIGRPQTNKKIEELSDKGMLKLSGEYPGLDGFVIKTIDYENRNYLVLGGSMDRGTLYAVYHLLENIFKVGFFEDGDRIPRKKTLVVKNINIAERPYFEIRAALPAGIYSRTAAFWGEKEWKKEIDWLLKKKYNLILQGFRKEIASEILNYTRERGMRVFYYAFSGKANPAFIKIHPKASYLKTTWLGKIIFSWLDPRDPCFVSLGTEHNKSLIQRYGTDHFYHVDPWGEVPLPGATAEERTEIQLAYARGVTRALLNADPQAINILSGWGFTISDFWSKEDAQAYLDNLRCEAIVIDVKAERQPAYKRLNYFWGKKWLFGIMPTSGSDSSLHGKLQDLIRRVQNVVKDPQATNCVGLYSQMESIGHNFLYSDLISQLAWDPEGITLEGFLQDYGLRRYGKESAFRMNDCLKELAKSIYAQRQFNYPHFHRLPYPDSSPEGSLSAKLLPQLEKALRIALEERLKQKESPFYARDLVDITRVYLDNALNCHITNLEEAFTWGRKERFEKQAQAINFYLENLEKLTSASPWPEYSLSRQIEQAKRWTRMDSNMSNEKWIRIGAGSARGIKLEDYPACLDYEFSDYFEALRFYYRPRLEFYIQSLHQRMEKGVNKISLEELDPAYKAIYTHWVNTPFEIEEKEKFAGTPVEVAAEVYQAIRKGRKEFPFQSLSASYSYQETDPIIIADDNQKDFWTPGVNGEGIISAPKISNDTGIKKEGKSSLRMVAGSGKHSRWSIIHIYRPGVDWSGKDLFTFYWYGANTGGKLSLSIASSGAWKDYFTTTFTDDFTGWKRLVFPFKSFRVVSGNPSWGHIEEVLIRTADDNLSGTWYLDGVAIDVVPGKMSEKVN